MDKLSFIPSTNEITLENVEAYLDEFYSDSYSDTPLANIAKKSYLATKFNCHEKELFIPAVACMRIDVACRESDYPNLFHNRPCPDGPRRPSLPLYGPR